jgi:hypothetical protein
VPDRILERASVTVCHGGSGTVYQSLAAGVPVLCLPGHPDQDLAARAATESEAGLVLDPTRIGARRLRGALDAILNETGFARAAHRIARAMRHHDSRGRWLDFLHANLFTARDERGTRPARRERPEAAFASCRVTEHNMTHRSKASEDHPGVRRRRPTAVSSALRALNTETGARAQTGPVEAWTPEPGGTSTAACRIRVASQRRDRERAYALAQRVYEQSGYVSPTETGMLVTPHDARPDTLTLLAEDALGRSAGTITLVFDPAPSAGHAVPEDHPACAGLPCDALFGDEVEPLRSAGRRLVEVTRLALKREQRDSSILLHLINAICVYAVRVRRFTDFVIEVNPRHVGFYRRLMGFEVLGSPRPCPRVNGSPAALMRLDLDLYVQAVRERARGRDTGPRPRSLYDRFLPLEREAAVGAFLARNHNAMTTEELVHFGLLACADGGQAPGNRPCANMSTPRAERGRPGSPPIPAFLEEAFGTRGDLSFPKR